MGGLRFHEDDGGDAHAFCQALAAVLVARGVRLELGCPVSGFGFEGSAIDQVQAGSRHFDACAVVRCAGIWLPARGICWPTWSAGGRPPWTPQTTR